MAKRRRPSPHKKPSSPAKIEQPIAPTFNKFSDTCAHVKPSVYIIARYRQVGEKAELTTLGTGFLAGDARLVTCSHVIDNENSPHNDGDAYLLMQVDEYGAWHRAMVSVIRNKTLFTYPNVDAAILYLPDDFYVVDGKPIKQRDQHLTLTRTVKPIGSDVGVIGYPMQEIKVSDTGIPQHESLHLRADKGVINTGHVTGGVAFTEFTMAFNPGNSGGPIFDAETGEVTAFVHGYNSTAILYAKERLPVHQHAELGATEVITSVRALYSIGICSNNLQQYAAKHGLSFT